MIDEAVQNVLETLSWTKKSKYGPAALASSFSLEDMVLTDLICTHVPTIEIFSIDTGRLPEETYQLWQRVNAHYGIRIRAYFPEDLAVERFVAEHGPNAFYQSVELRKTCCYVRKVEPLKRALAGKRAWITGMRREQSPSRQALPVVAWDEENQLYKFSPLAAWNTDEVRTYVHRHGVPFNPLYDRGYPSIGCAPCTRSVTVGEDIRAGRWWWEQDDTDKECGLHVAGENHG